MLQTTNLKYKCPIPSFATERIRKMYPNGSKEICDYFVNGKPVGVRFFSDSGVVELEHGIKSGTTHGTHSEWNSDGKLMFRENYVDGKAHGVARQWSTRTGKFRMNHGTGIDLWWHDWLGRVHLSEVRYMRNGVPHGAEWWLNSNEKSVWSERWWRYGKKHGIERQWNSSGNLQKGFPKYFLSDKQVSRWKYLKDLALDPAQPPYRSADNKPLRSFPSEIRKYLRRKSKS